MNSLSFVGQHCFQMINLTNFCGMKRNKTDFIKPANMESFPLWLVCREGPGQKSGSCKACSILYVFILY